MERHFDHDLEELKQRLLWMGSLAERAVHQAVHAVLDAEEHLAETVLSEEDAINEMQIEIDERVQRLSGRLTHQWRPGTHRRSGREHRAIRHARSAPPASEALRGSAPHE